MSMRYSLAILYSLVSLNFIGLQSCVQQQEEKSPNVLVQVLADIETQPVANNDDAADDPAIWIHPTDPSLSLLICSNKKSGIMVYDLQGNEKGHYPVGKINNVDVRQGIYLNDKVRVDIAAGSNRTDNSITIMAIHADGTLTDITARKIFSNFSEVYGFCLYHDLDNKTVYAIVNNKAGMVEQWRLLPTDSLKLDAELTRTFRGGESQLEGCVGDDETGFIYIGEENTGIWKFRAHPDSNAVAIKVDDISSNTALKDDIEGLTIIYKENGHGYLIASSQGNNTFAVYRREGNNEYVGSFEIIDGPQIDGVSETDGIDVTSFGLGAAFPSGLFIAQDGNNFDDGISKNQNFKLVSWGKIETALKL